MSNESFRAMLAGSSPEGTQSESEQQPTETKAKATRGRKKKNETAIAKTKGHQLVDQQRSEAGSTVMSLDDQELRVRAMLAYQSGQVKAATVDAAETAGYLDKMTTIKTEKIEGLIGILKDNAEGFNPLAVLEEMGLVGDDGDTKKKLDIWNATDLEQYFV